jgi:hypothetical protein
MGNHLLYSMACRDRITLGNYIRFQGKKAISASNGTLVGNGRAWWCLIVGGLGIILWLPVIIIAIINQF